MCALVDAFDLGRKSVLDKQELIKFLKDSLKVKIETETYYSYKQIKIIILLDGEVISANTCML